MRDIVAQLVEQRPAAATISIVTHNDQPFEDPAHESSQRLEHVLSSVSSACAASGLEAVGATVDQVCERVLAMPPEEPPGWDARCDVSGRREADAGAVA